MARVSVIIPNYNHARFLAKRIQSVLSQSYGDFEIIYLDDASTDNSSEVFAQFAGDPHICKVILNQTNSGSPFKQWNKGIRESSGEYIWIAESDDFADERLLEVLVKRLDLRPDIGMAYCQSILVDDTERYLGICKDWTDEFDSNRWNKDYLNNGCDECARYLCRRNTVPNASAVVFRRSEFECAGGANERLRLCGDWLLWVKILLVSNIAFVAEPLNYFRKHADTVSQTIAEDSTMAEVYPVLLHMARNWMQIAKVSPAAPDDLCENLIEAWKWCATSTRSEYPEESAAAIFKIVNGMGYTISRHRKADVYAALTFSDHAKRDFGAVRRNIFKAIRHDPSWLRKRGVWSIGAQAFLGWRSRARDIRT